MHIIGGRNLPLGSGAPAIMGIRRGSRGLQSSTQTKGEEGLVFTLFAYLLFLLLN